jgi:hypothetical protein
MATHAHEFLGTLFQARWRLPMPRVFFLVPHDALRKVTFFRAELDALRLRQRKLRHCSSSKDTGLVAETSWFAQHVRTCTTQRVLRKFGSFWPSVCVLKSTCHVGRVRHPCDSEQTRHRAMGVKAVLRRETDAWVARAYFEL